MKAITYIGGSFIVFAIFFFLFAIVDNAFYNAEKLEEYGEITEVDCYDRYSNQIVGETCLKKNIQFFYISDGFLPFILFSGLLLAMGIHLFSIGVRE